MATLNKTSLRTEFEAIKARCAALCANGKLSAEGRALFEAMLMLFELLLAVFMEKHTPKGTHNSGLPSARTEPDETARGQTGAKGKGRRAAAAPSAGWSRPTPRRSARAGPVGTALTTPAPAATSGAYRSIASSRRVN